ncbi:MAG: hypothetical protein KC441_12235 [Anaerolineales bacterium]|nr:hypothetical protein [Anaerolineales bacterium]MCA9943399.1 hypothetical protein [Anaerolineales bacterium]
MEYDDNDLRHMTQIYWQLLAEGNRQEAMEFYLRQAKLYGEPIENSLLECEMGWAKEQNDLPQPHLQTTLVILVGDSFEPLLQSIWAYNPTKLVPVVNEYYGDKDEKSTAHKTGQAQWDDLRDWITMLLQKTGRKQFLVPKEPAMVTDNPTEIFEHLRQKLQDDLSDTGTRVVIDITGAKKTMVTGAFLLAAYSKTEINYIDVGEYDDQKRPFGFSCEFSTVANPLNDLFLQSWDRVKRHYRRYDFDGALASLPDAASLPGDGLKQLRHYLEIYDLWENGRLYEAKEKADGLSKNVPATVSLLGSYWPKPGASRLNSKFFEDPMNIILFAEDELRRAKRLQQHGLAKAAFTKAYALYETLLTARIVALYESNQIKLISPDKDTRPLFKVQDEFDWFVDLPAANTTNLLTKGTQKWHFQYEGVDYKPTFSHRIRKSCLPQQTLKKTRNLVTHTYFPVIPQIIADAIALAQKNIQDYQTHWATMHDPQLKIKEGKTENMMLELISGTKSIKIKEDDFLVPEWEALMYLCELSRYVTPKNR